jgi:hypothetical protein
VGADLLQRSGSSFAVLARFDDGLMLIHGEFQVPGNATRAKRIGWDFRLPSKMFRYDHEGRVVTHQVRIRFVLTFRVLWALLGCCRNLASDLALVGPREAKPSPICQVAIPKRFTSWIASSDSLLLPVFFVFIRREGVAPRIGPSI